MLVWSCLWTFEIWLSQGILLCKHSAGEKNLRPPCLKNSEWDTLVPFFQNCSQGAEGPNCCLLLSPQEGITDTCLPFYLSTFLPTDQEDHLLAVNHLGIVALVFVVFVHSMLPERHLPVVMLW